LEGCHEVSLQPSLTGPASPMLKWERCCSPLTILVPSSGPSPAAPRLSCAEGPTPGCSTADGASQQQNRGGDDPLLVPSAVPLLMEPRIPLAFQAASARCWLTFSFSSATALSQGVLLPACIHLLDEKLCQPCSQRSQPLCTTSCQQLPQPFCSRRSWMHGFFPTDFQPKPLDGARGKNVLGVQRRSSERDAGEGHCVCC